MWVGEGVSGVWGAWSGRASAVLPTLARDTPAGPTAGGEGASCVRAVSRGPVVPMWSGGDRGARSLRLSTWVRGVAFGEHRVRLGHAERERRSGGELVYRPLGTDTSHRHGGGW